MSKKMLINASHPEENRVAIVVDGVLSELDIEIAGQEQTKGNIYKAVVVRVESGLQAAFVDYGAEKLGFLQIGEIHPNLLPKNDDGKGRARINDILHRGQEILVQIVKEERGNKGAALTTNLSVPGRYMVLMPDSTTKGVSRKILDDPERKKLKRTMAELNLPERMGYIVRTAGIGKEKEELRRDFDYLVRLFEGIIARKDQVKAPAQLYQESNLVIRSIRDYFTAEMDEVLIDDQKVYQETKDFFALVMPEHSHLVKPHRERRPIFSRYQIEEQIDALAKNHIPLPSGGSIVIDQTEALVSIDVNSGKMSSESGIEATAAKTNLEAAFEVGRQLRLRDLGGLVVIDFIDMRDRKHIREVEQELRKSLKDDKAKVTVGRISQFGLMEMSRQRLKPTLSVGSYLECPHCLGKGRIKSAENQAVSLLRQIHATASKGHIGHIEASVPIDVANDMLNSKRQSLVELEKRLNLKVSIIGRVDMLPGQLEIELYKREKDADTSSENAPVSHANQIEYALAAAQMEANAEPADQPETLTEDVSLLEREVDMEVDETPLAGEATTELADDGDKVERKSRRRRRRRRRKNDSDAEQTVSSLPVADQLSETAAALTTEPLTESVTEIVAEKPVSAPDSSTDGQPKRQRSRKPAVKKNAEPAEATTAASEETERESVTPVPAGVATQQTEDPAVAVKATDTPADTTQATQEKQPTGQKRRTRRAPKRTQPAAVETADESTPELIPKQQPGQATEKTVEAVLPDAIETAVAEKPKQRATRSRQKPIAKVIAETAVGVEPAPAKKPPGRPRRITKKSGEGTSVNAKVAPSPAEMKPLADQSIEKDAAGPVTAADTAAKGEEKPKRRPGRPRKTVKPAATETE
jgi:ribonuclease E